MPWNWASSDWPRFAWDAARLTRPEQLFLQQAGVVIGARRHLAPEHDEALVIDLMSSEAFFTSRIEGETLDRDSIQASIRRQLGLAADRRSGPAEAGIAEMIVDLYRHPQDPLNEATLFSWHEMVMNGRRDVASIGWYRCHNDDTEVVSGPVHRRRIHFVAPPSEVVPRQMERFLGWFRDTGPRGATPLPGLTRAGIAHLWFESVHPFEDGNGRIGRAIVEKVLAQGTEHPVLTGVSTAILRRRKEYYAALDAANRSLEVTEWLRWFASVIVEAQRRTLAEVEFVISKGRLFGQAGDAMNERQKKAVVRMFEAGLDGFEGGLSASNYMSITGAPPATATRDLTGLVGLGVLVRSGTRKSTRYHLNVEIPVLPPVLPDEIDPPRTAQNVTITPT